MIPLVTVYITNYNYGSYIRQAIESLLGQTYKNIEIYIIDDGSTDDSKNIILQYEHLPNIRIVFQQNKGLNATNNVAMKLARGKYLMRLDADDYLHESAIEKMVKKIEQEPDAALIFPDYYNVDKNGEIINEVRRHDFNNDVTLLDQPAHGAITLIKLDVLKKEGGYDEEFTRQDGYDLWLKIAHKYKVININEPLFYYRQHGKSITDNESALLKVRGEIKAKHVKGRELEKSKVLAIIPVRGEEVDKRSLPMRRLGDKELICWTIDEALAVPEITDVVITSPSSSVLDFVNGKYPEEKVICLKRGLNLSRINQKIDDTIIETVKRYSENNSTPDLIMILYVEAPFRSKQYIQEAIDTLKLYEVNAVEAVRPDNGIFYVHDGSGLKYIQENHDLQLERNEIYRRAGGMHLVKFEQLMKQQNLNFERTGHIILDQKASIFIRSEFDWKVAKLLIESYEK